MPKISELPLSGQLSGNESIPVVQDGVTKQISVSSIYDGDCGEILDNITLTGTQSETILYSLKIPANFYKVGDMMTIGPSVVVWGGYDDNNQSSYVGPFVKSSEYSYGVNGLPILGYANQTLTFSTTTNIFGASGLVVSITFDETGDFDSSSESSDWTIVNPGDGYRAGGTITFQDLGSGVFNLYITDNNYNDPQARIRAYWSYDENGLDNFAEVMTLDYYFAGWKHVFNVATPSYNFPDWYSDGLEPLSNNLISLTEEHTPPTYGPIPFRDTGKLPSVSKIINPTTIKYISDQNQTPPFDFVIGTVSIPDITKDIYITLTGELESANTLITLGLVKALRRVSIDDLFGHGSQTADTLTIDPFRQTPINTFQESAAV